MLEIAGIGLAPATKRNSSGWDEPIPYIGRAFVCRLVPVHKKEILRDGINPSPTLELCLCRDRACPCPKKEILRGGMNPSPTLEEGLCVGLSKKRNSAGWDKPIPRIGRAFVCRLVPVHKKKFFGME